MNCEEFRDLYELYVLGALETAERTGIDEHLQRGCAVCRTEIQRALEQVAIVSRKIPLVEPPKRLRLRIAESFGVPPKHQRTRWQFLPWLAAAAAVLALGIGLGLEKRARQVEAENVRQLSSELTRMSHVFEILQAPGTQEISFGKAGEASPHGHLFVHQKLGIVLVSSQIPAAPAGWQYESWLVPKNGPPRPVEPFRLDANGRAISVLPGPFNPAELSAVAVSMEPDYTRPVKPTKVLFAAPLEQGNT